MRTIIGRPRVADNRDARMTRRHRAVAADRDSSGTRRDGRVASPAAARCREGDPMQFHGSKLARRVTAGASAIALLASIGASGVLAAGPPSLAFYVDDVRSETVGAPTDFFGTGAPDSSFDKIYDLGTGINVAEAKPGDTDFNGGRWQVYLVTWAQGVTPVQYTNDP